MSEWFNYKNWTTIQKVWVIFFVISLLLGLVVKQIASGFLIIAFVCAVGFFLYRKK
jgi:hypothetical protein